jgi:hypothetical protein
MGTAMPAAEPNRRFIKNELAAGAKKNIGSTKGMGNPKPVMPGVPKDVLENPPGISVGPNPVNSGKPPPVIPGLIAMRHVSSSLRIVV